MKSVLDVQFADAVGRALVGFKRCKARRNLFALGVAVAAFAVTAIMAAGFNGGAATLQDAGVAYAATRDSWNAQDRTKHPGTCPCDADTPAGTECESDGIAFIWIPPGSFTMGGRMSPEQISARYGGAAPNTFRGEYPLHKVTLTRGFWLGKYEVTNIAFSRFVDATGYRTDAERAGRALGIRGYSRAWQPIDGISWRNPGWDIEPDQPAVLITWNDATAFCEWMSEATGKRYRLPTDAEWEYACRAGTDTEFPWGNDLEDGYGWINGADQTGDWFRSSETRFPFKDGAAYVARVGSYFPNTWGLYDMNGNVWEWCQDWQASLPSGSVTDPKGPPSGTQRIIRGGGWHAIAAYCRSSTRFSDPPEHTHTNMGFRVVRVP